MRLSLSFLNRTDDAELCDQASNMQLSPSSAFPVIPCRVYWEQLVGAMEI